jgi:hypothetical protein
MGMEKYTPNRARFLVRKKYKTVSTVRIVALQSVNKIFPERYDFAARLLADPELTDTLLILLQSVPRMATLCNKKKYIYYIASPFAIQ